MTALYQLTHTMNTAIEDMNNTIENAIENKADNIIFNPEDSTIQLSANGVPVGDKIVVNTNTGAVVTNAGISSDNELILTFNDGTVKNLGSVMGKDGAVYVPHISRRKVLTFTIEDEPGETQSRLTLIRMMNGQKLRVTKLSRIISGSQCNRYKLLESVYIMIFFCRGGK